MIVKTLFIIIFKTFTYKDLYFGYIINNILKYCPSCGASSEQEESQERKEPEYPEVYFIDVIINCNKCGLGWNCIGTKKVK